MNQDKNGFEEKIALPSPRRTSLKVRLRALELILCRSKELSTELGSAIGESHRVRFAEGRRAMMIRTLACFGGPHRRDIKKPKTGIIYWNVRLSWFTTNSKIRSWPFMIIPPPILVVHTVWSRLLELYNWLENGSISTIFDTIMAVHDNMVMW